jgi:hypothetical protein
MMSYARQFICLKSQTLKEILKSVPEDFSNRLFLIFQSLFCEYLRNLRDSLFSRRSRKLTQIW